MTQGEGLVALLYAIKGILQVGAIWVLTGAAVIAFFWIIIKLIGQKSGAMGGDKINRNAIVYGIFILFVIFAIYSLVALTGSNFGVNSSPSGGIYVSR